MEVYTKINTLYKRFMNIGKGVGLPNPKWKVFQNLIIPGSFSDQSVEFLKDCQWECYSKIDGTNSKIAFYPSTGTVKIGGKTDKANSQHGQFEMLQEIADRILPQLKEMYPPESAVFTPEINKDTNKPEWIDVETLEPTKPIEDGLYQTKLVEAPVYIYGEYYGAGIQKCGGRYSDKNDFVVFDICQQGWWIPKNMRDEICHKLNLPQVPYLGNMTLSKAEDVVRNGFTTHIDAKDKTLIEEGIVARPIIPVKDVRGKRLIVKIKYCDYAAFQEAMKQVTPDEYKEFKEWYEKNIENLNP